MARTTSTFAAWAVDSLEKVWREAQPPSGSDSIVVEACRNEFASAQVAVHATQPLPELRVSVSPLKHADTGAAGVEVSARFVGYVPIKANTPDTPEEELDCTAPCLVPDPLLAEEVVKVEADSTQPIWLTISVPPEAPAGRWRGTVEVSAGSEVAELPLEVTVLPVTLPAERHLWVTNWVSMENFAKFYATEMYTPRFWEVVEAYARNMGAHRQNVMLCPNELIRIFQESDGKLSFDYSDFDRWVGIFSAAGCADLIEGGHVGRRGEGKWETPWFEWRKFKVTRRDGAEVQLPPEQVVEALVKDLVGHVRDQGWFDRFLLHVVDEPAAHTEEDYRKKSRLMHEWAPGVRFLEAMSLLDARGLLDVWVPNLDHLDEHRDHYLGLKEEGDFELWFYTCMYPVGRYPNRFLDFSLLKTRLLHWLNWRYQLPGYLHWGLNYWTDDPFHNDRIRDDLPPGDCWIVYPGADGPLDSLRWEQMREGLQDFELLWLLNQREREAGGSASIADRICSGLVPDPLKYSRRWADLRSARRAAIDSIIELER